MIYSNNKIIVTAYDGFIYLQIPYQLKALGKAVPGSTYNKDKKQWQLKSTIATLMAVEQEFTKYKAEFHYTFQNELDEIRNKAVRAENIKKSDPNNIEDPPIYVTQPWNHQKQAYWYCKEMNNLLLDMGMGSGKSKVVVDFLNNEQQRKKVIIICPKSVIPVWFKQFKLHGINQLHDKIYLAKGSVKNKTETAKWLNQQQEGIFVINYDSFWRDPLRFQLYNYQPDLLIFDESHFIKSTSSKRGKFAYELSKRSKKTICLTGTPIPHSPEDLLGQFRVIDPSIFGTSVHRFRDKYCIQVPITSRAKKVVGYIPGAIDEIREKMQSHSFRVKTEDVIDLPETIHQERFLSLPDKARRTYETVAEQLYIDITHYKEEKEPEALKAAVAKLTKLRQICSGFIKLEDGSVEQLHKEKVKLLDEIWNEKGQPNLVVFYSFTASADLIKGHFGKEVPIFELSGRSGVEAESGLNDWNELSSLEGILLVQIKAGGAGIDLTKANHCVYFDLDYSLGDFDQSKARVHRPGQTKTTFYSYLLTSKFYHKSCIDEQIYTSLSERKDFLKTVFGEIINDPTRTDEG